MGFSLGGFAKGAIGGFIGSGFNPLGALGGGVMGGLSGGGGGGSGSGGAQGQLNQAAQTYGGYAGEDRNRYLSALQNGQSSLNNYAQGAMSAAMPQFQHQLQGVRESAIQRGVSNGDLGTSYEGDLASAFDRNMSNAIAGQSMNMYGAQLQGYGNMANESSNTYLDLLSGNRDANQAQQNNQNSLYGSIIGAAGQIGGAYLGRR